MQKFATGDEFMDFNQMFGSWAKYLGGLPNLILAFIVLLVGWLIAKAIGGTVSKILSKTRLDQKTFEWFSEKKDEDGSRRKPISATIGKVVYYAVLVFVYLIFFNMLNLSIVAQPIVNMLSAITTAIPNVIQAALILLLGWIVATILKFVVVIGGQNLHFDRLLIKISIVETEEEGTSFISTLGKIVFYLVLILFLPGVLNPLNISGITQPLSSMIGEFLNFLPYLIGAAVIVLIGWLIAKIVRDILTNLLRAVGLDKLSERIGFSEMLGGTRLSSIIGTIVFILILIPTMVTALKKLHLQGISKPAIQMLNEVFTMIPNIIVALLLIMIGVILSRWVGRFIAELLGRLGFNNILSSLGLGSMESTVIPSRWVGRIAQIVVILLFTVEALQVVQFKILVTVVSVIIGYLPDLFVSILIMGVGLYLGNLVSRIINGIGNSEGKDIKFFALVAKYAIFAFSLFMVLDQLSIAASIVNAAFIITLGAVAVAFALSFGLGGREFASKVLAKWERRVQINSDNQEE